MNNLLIRWCWEENKKAGIIRKLVSGWVLLGCAFLLIAVTENVSSLHQVLSVVFVVTGFLLMSREKGILYPRSFCRHSFVPDSFLGFIAESSLVEQGIKEAVAEAIRTDGEITFGKLQEIWDKQYRQEPPSQKGRDKLMKFLR